MIDPGADWHTHSSTTDGQDPLIAMVIAGAAAGLHTLGLSDHVRASTTWLPDYVREVRTLAGRTPLTLRCGVEAKILDRAGRLDLPDDLPELDYVLVADHQFPGEDGPVHPDRVRALLEDGTWDAADCLDQLVTATALALAASPVPPVLAHLFSLLPKCGLDEEQLDDQHLDALADACLATGGWVEVNEKWRCPGARTLRHLHRRGVTLSAGSDAHRAADVGRWAYLPLVSAELT
ncbi:PHP domain-containing protein [Serinicoccus kebangsaanensis]|uniref:PHP domain-containing protein n=1 Tax=Serinicoccus kebangsaanensis TaxID=2602069 RepID=UPI00124C2865|nr:PHP domain-containing protein [Serinicoccus kebangsaanensis]